MGGAQAALLHGLLACNDGDVQTIDAPIPAGLAQAFINSITQEHRTIGLTIMIATKITWFQTNHHTGGVTGRLAGYINKVVNAMIPEPVRTNVGNDLATAIHAMGHWVSTKIVVASLSMGAPEGFAYNAAWAASNIADRENLVQAAHGSAVGAYVTVLDAASHGAAPPITISSDILIRLSSAPSGTGRTSIAVTALKLLSQHPLAYLFPYPADLAQVGVRAALVKANPRACHVGSQYLVGRARVFVDSDTDLVMGRLGTFITKIFPMSTVSKSPHFAANKITTYPDYSNEWENICVQSIGVALNAQALDAVLAALGTGGGASVLSITHIDDMRRAAGVAAADPQAVFRTYSQLHAVDPDLISEASWDAVDVALLATIAIGNNRALLPPRPAGAPVRA